MWRRVAHRRPVSGSSQATEPTGRGQRSSCFVASVERGPVQIDLGWIIVKDILTPPLFLLEVDELLELFGAFLLVLVGMELLNMVKAYITEKTVHVEVTLVVAIIAIARKVVILEPKGLDALTLVGIAAIIFALTAGYYFVKRTRQAR